MLLRHYTQMGCSVLYRLKAESQWRLLPSGDCILLHKECNLVQTTLCNYRTFCKVSGDCCIADCCIVGCIESRIELSNYESTDRITNRMIELRIE